MKKYIYLKIENDPILIFIKGVGTRIANTEDEFRNVLAEYGLTHEGTI